MDEQWKQNVRVMENGDGEMHLWCVKCRTRICPLDHDDTMAVLIMMAEGHRC